MLLSGSFTTILYQPVELTNVRSVRESFTRQQMDSQSVRSVVGKSKLLILQIFTECEKLFILQIFIIYRMRK